MQYRRDQGSKTWHCCRNCSRWPRGSFNIISFESFPADFELCSECLALQRAQKCSETNTKAQPPATSRFPE